VAAASSTTVSFRGKQLRRRAHEVDGVPLVINGRWLRLASIFDEEWQECERITDPASFVAAMQAERVPADILTFTQQLPDTAPKHALPFELTNLAVADCTDYEAWWAILRQNARSDVRRARKVGLVIEEMAFDDEFARGVKEIYDESPVRQGRKFWHYGKSLEAVKRENMTYLDRSIVIGARHEGELVGFLKLVRIGEGARVMQILAKTAHLQKKPMHALIAKAVEICSARGLKHLVYGPYSYGANTSVQLTDFKRRNGFQEVTLPRYYVPLNARGRLALRLRLHLGAKHFVPNWADRAMRDVRAAYYRWRFPAVETKGDAK